MELQELDPHLRTTAPLEQRAPIVGNIAILGSEFMIDDTDILLDELESKPYEDTRQPVYPNRVALKSTMHELKTSDADSTYETVLSVRLKTEAIVLGTSSNNIRILGRCVTRVDAKHDKIQDVANENIALIDAVADEEPESLTVIRNTTEKPRSNEFDTVEDPRTKQKRRIMSFYGYGVNGPEKSNRLPDASRLVSVLAHIRSVGEKLNIRYEEHIPTARESLSIPMMLSMMRNYEGKVYSIESDILWIGDRTRQLDGIHVTTLEKLQPENVIGVKIGPTATPEDIAGLKQKLNPNSSPGKLMFMFRIGIDNMDKMHALLEAVRDEAPESILLYDIHGAKKPRDVSEMIEETWILSAMCAKYSLKLHGTHIEAMGFKDKKQCIDKAGDIPDDDNIMDPQLNLEQVKRFHKETAKVLW